MTIISTFRERPKTRTAVWAFRLGVSVLFTPFIMGMYAAVGRTFITSLTNDALSIVVGIGLVVIVLSAAVAAFVLSIKAFRLGERSWQMWFGLIPASLAVLFWLFMIIGEFLFPH